MDGWMDGFDLGSVIVEPKKKGIHTVLVPTTTSTVPGCVGYLCNNRHNTLLNNNDPRPVK
jgi:hypothetical protein